MPLNPLLRRLVDVRDGEVAALLWAFLYFFSLLAAYYVLRPIRDEMGIAGGVKNLQWLFTGTFAAMLIAVPIYGSVVARWPRRLFVPWVYQFFVLNILVFFALMTYGEGAVHVGRAFYIWVSVFNLFVVSVFWSFMADLFRSEQGRRLFGFIAAGGSLGALVGPGLTEALVIPLGPVNLLLVSALLLQVSVLCIGRLLKCSPNAGGHPDPDAAEERAVGGGILAGAIQALSNPYLARIVVYMLIFTTTSTFLYFLQANIVAEASDDPTTRTQIFNRISLASSLLTILIQMSLTGRLMSRLGVGPMLGLLPLVTLAGFTALALAPVVLLVIAFQAVRRAANYALSRPAREVLYTVVDREQKYKAKSFIDTVVYRGGDAASGWLFAGLSGLGLGLPAIAALTVPVALAWLWLALALGRRQNRLALAG